MILRYMTAGESHGPALVAVIEGLPAGLPLTEDLIAIDLKRRQQGVGSGERMVIEKDRAVILSGVMEGCTIGAPLAMRITNIDHAYWKGREVPPFTTPRPGHADLAALIKYGYSDVRLSLERASARSTTTLVAVGAVCRALLERFGITVGGYVAELAGIKAELDNITYAERLTRARSTSTQCPDSAAAARMEARVKEAESEGDTLGGVIEIVAQGVPPGLGSHVHWDRRLDARLAGALMGVPAMKGVEIGDAFANAARPGTAAHDAILPGKEGFERGSNRCGGIEGGVSNGSPVWVRVAMKPIPTTQQGHCSVDLATGLATQSGYERSDICPVPRAVVVLESVVAYVLANEVMRKLGGDSIREMLPRFEALGHALNPRLTSGNHLFWS